MLREFIVSKLNVTTVYVVLILASLLPLHKAVGERSQNSDVLPPLGWYVYPSSEIEKMGDGSHECFNRSRNDWKVTTEGNEIEISKLPRPNRGASSAVVLMPARLTLQPGMPGKAVAAGLKTAMHLHEGWLLAYDAGEWGGGLWLTNEDGSVAKRIVDENVHGVVPMDGGFLVLSGLAHMGMDFGNARFFSTPNGLNTALRFSVRLDGAPRAYAKESDGNVLFVTTEGLSRVNKNGELQALARLPKWTKFQYANSMAILSDGSVFVGMRMFVLRLSPSSDGYTQQWLLPVECRAFHVEPGDCVCAP
jgi:hypothetical protein